MPGEKTLLEEFIQQQLSDTAEKRLLGRLVGRVFEAMEFAGKGRIVAEIEEHISDALKKAKNQWLNPAKAERQLVLFELHDDRPHQTTLEFDVAGITDAAFWEEAEQRIYAALSQYSEQAADGGYKRRLFSDDIAQGFSFIDLCRTRYDVALMNPPFGDASIKSLTILDNQLARCGRDIGAAFCI